MIKKIKGVKSEKYIIYCMTWLLILFFSPLKGQDAHFSQFYASPLTLNPATVGTYGGTFRVSTLYRDQWRSAVDQPLQTYTVNGDVKFNVAYNKNYSPDIVGLGITFFGDRVNSFEFNTNQIVLTAGYHKSLDVRTKQYLGIAVQGGILARSLNYENLTFEDQFNAVDGYTLATGENLVPNNRAASDISLGLYYTISPSKIFDFHAGLGYFHINRPNMSWYNIEEIRDPNVNKTDVIHPKWSAHLGASYKYADFITFQPRANVLIQGPYSELNLGGTFRFKVSKRSGKYFLLGPYIRGVQNKNAMGLESVIAMTGLEMNDFIFGFSYDQNVGGIIRGRRSLSSFEFSVIYIGEYHNEDNFCPQW